MTTKTATAPTTTLETIVEEIMETEEDILARQVVISEPNKAKQLAKAIIKEKN